MTIKYFTSPNCLYCWIEEFSLGKITKSRGELFALEKYDIRFCNQIAREYRITGTPGFVFSNGDEEETVYGYMNRDKIEAMVCNSLENLKC